MNGTKDEPVADEAAGGTAAVEALGRLHFHPLYADRLTASIQCKQEALAAAARQAIPSLARTIERMKACPEGIEPRLALQTANLLHAALIAIQGSLTLDGAAADRDDFNRLKREMDDLQRRLTEAVEQIVAEKAKSG